jgi:hypothetical protein
MPETVFGIGSKDPDVDLTTGRFPKTAAAARNWGSGHRVDLGPIRLTTRQAWGIAWNATVDAVKDRAGRSRDQT